MMWLAAARLGTGQPRSAQAAWMLWTMTPAESISVPSQSKIRSSKRLAWPVSQLIGRSGSVKIRQVGRQWAPPVQRQTADRVQELKARRMQEHAFQALTFFKARFSSKSPYLSSPAMACLSAAKVHPNLVRPAGLQLGFEKAVAGIAPGQTENGMGDAGHPGRR
jgi:hypothetical protein